MIRYRRAETPSQILKRTVSVADKNTSVSLETGFWSALKEIAARERIPVSTLVTRIDSEREHTNLSSVIRLFVLEHYGRLAEERTGRKESDAPSWQNR
jgi:predicted DNA-binding ribbon-helix-helix protein